MRVAAIVPLYPPASRVGAWLATHELLAALVAAGHEVEVVQFLHKLTQPYEIDGVIVQPTAMLREVMERSDVVISHLGDGGANHRSALLLGKPSVRMVHGGLIDTRLLAGSSLVVCNSHATKALLGRYSGPTVVVHPPTDPEKFKTTPGDRVTLVNLSSEKGGDIFWRVARGMPKTKFLGVHGGYGEQIYGRAPNVDVIPNTPNMRDDVYARTRILLMPSTAESWGMVAVEAMCSGIPVIAKPTAGLREALGDAGIWQENSNTQQWVNRIRELEDPREWHKASRKSLARAAELDPVGEKELFVRSIETLVSQGATA